MFQYLIYIWTQIGLLHTSTWCPKNKLVDDKTTFFPPMSGFLDFLFHANNVWAKNRRQLYFSSALILFIENYQFVSKVNARTLIVFDIRNWMNTHTCLFSIWWFKLLIFINTYNWFIKILVGILNSMIFDIRLQKLVIYVYCIRYRLFFCKKTAYKGFYESVPFFKKRLKYIF